MSTSEPQIRQFRRLKVSVKSPVAGVPQCPSVSTQETLVLPSRKHCITVSNMETPRDLNDPDHPQDADTARAAVEAAQAEEAITMRRLTPGWFGPAVAALLLVAFGLQAYRPEEGPWRAVITVVTLIACLSVAALQGALYRETTYRQPKTAWGLRAVVSLLVVAAIAVAPIVLEPEWGSWVWLCSGVLLAGLLIAFWHHHRKSVSHG